MATVDKVAYATTATITSTFASLASSATAGRGSATVDNTTNLYIDASLTIGVKTSSSTLANDKACYVYLWGMTGDASTPSGSSAEAVGTDIAVTIDSPTNLKLAGVINCPASSQTYRLTIGSVAAYFGGIMPQKWGFVLRNYTGQALDSTEGNHLKTYSGITFTNA